MPTLPRSNAKRAAGRRYTVTLVGRRMNIRLGDFLKIAWF